MSLGIRIRELRRERGLTQQDLASILKVRNTTLSQYENNVNIPSDDVKLHIAKYFDVSLDYLYGVDAIKKRNYNHIISTEGLEDNDIDILNQLANILRDKNGY